MGKQAKKRHRDAVTLAAQAHPVPQATPKPKPAKPMPPVKTAANTDMLTGAYLDPTLPRWYLDGDNSRPEAARVAIPSRIHTRDVEFGGLGGHRYASAFEKYMLPVLPRIVAEEKRQWICWWEIEYVYNRVRIHLGQEALDVALASLKDGNSLTWVAKEYHHSFEWVNRKTYQVTLLAETYFTHRSSRGPRTQRAAAE
jgi:hypothetical protein